MILNHLLRFIYFYRVIECGVGIHPSLLIRTHLVFPDLLIVTADQFHQDQENSQIPYNQTQYSLPATGANAQNYQSHIPSHLVEADEIDTSDPNSTIPTSFPPENFYSHPPFPFHSPFPQQSYVNPTYYYPSQYQTNTDVSQQFPPSEFSTFDQSSYNPFTQTSSQYDWSYLPESQTEYTASVETPPSIPSSSVPPSPSSSTASHTINKTPTMSTTNKPPRVMPFRSDATGFVTKLYWLLENREEFGDCIRWDEKGEAFLVDIGSKQFLEEILPDLFLHKSPTSFCRQLQTCKS